MDTTPLEDAGSATFLSLLKVHEELDALFARHQEALLDRDITTGTRILDEFGAGIREHIRLEEEVLLPIYGRAGEILGGGTELYLAEHRKILEILDTLRARMEEMSGTRPAAETIIAVLDEESRFKQLMEHHDLRERNLLYPALDRVATAAEKEAWLPGESSGNVKAPA